MLIWRGTPPGPYGPGGTASLNPRIVALARGDRYIQITFNPGPSMLKEFKAFVMRGNVLDLAVALIIGAAFGTVVKSLVDDVIMPPIGLALGNVDFANLFFLLKAGPKAPPPYPTLADAHAAG